jgi:YggT family protein
MQSNQYPNDPNYIPPLQENPQGVPPYQPGQPGYPNQPGVPQYQGQPGVPYGTPPNQYVEDPALKKAQARKYGVAKVMDYLQWVLIALELLFLLRFVLKFLGADPNNAFAQALYNFTGFFLYPFLGIVPTTKIGTNGNSVIEWSTLIGMAVYALLFYIIKLLLRTTISRPQEPIQ